MLLKPRKNRLDGDGEFRVVRPHSVPLVAMGGLVLVVGECPGFGPSPFQY